MGSQKDWFRDFAIAFWKTAREDLRRAEDFTENEATLALTRAKFVFKEITSLLKREYRLEIIE